jgi:ribonuclease T2
MNTRLVVNALAVLALIGAALIFNWQDEAGTRGSGRSAQPNASADIAGDFDFYVLALSWSPTWCEEKGDDADGEAQCSTSRPYGFVVHGLWPQNEQGWPQFCESTFGERIDRSIADQMLDIMPSRDLVFHQWRKHGACSGLAPEAFFSLARRAYEAVQIPSAYQRIANYQTVGVSKVEDVFMAANPSLKADSIAVICSNRFLREVRICLDKSLKFRSCREVDAKSCQKDTITMPPVRG